INVGGNDDGPMTVFCEPFAELAGGSGLTGSLQADDEPHCRRAGAELRLGFAAEKLSEFVADNFYDLLIGGKLQQHFRADSLGANVGDEFVGDAHVDVTIEQRFADFAESGIEVLFCELSLAAEVFERALKFLCKSLKHGRNSILAGARDCDNPGKAGRKVLDFGY